MTEKNHLSEICKWNVGLFLFYVFWFQYAYREIVSIIYVTGLVAIICMLADLLLNNLDFSSVFPFGVSVNLVMCVYSIITGIFVAIAYEFLISQIKTYACYTLMCMAICYVTYNEKDIEWLAKLLVCISLVCCLQVTFKGYYKGLYGYVMSENNNPNSLGLVLDLGIFGIIYLFSKIKQNYLKTLCFGLILYFLAIIVGCGSRKCLIAAVIIILLWMIPLVREKMAAASVLNKGLILLFALLAVVAVVYYYNHVYIYTDSYNRMTILGNTTNAEGSSAKRELYYKLAVESFLQHPVFGIGYQQFIYTNKYKAISHSTYAEALASWGTIGSIIYFIPVFSAGKRLISQGIKKGSSYISRALVALWAMEIFLGVGQIWFYSVEHLVAWTMIYLADNIYSEKKDVSKRRCKYVKA